MYIRVVLAFLALATAFGAPLSDDQITKRQSSNEDTLADQLVLATTDVERISLLAAAGNESFVFNFAPQGINPSGGGSVVLANAASFPALIGRKSAAALFILNPCGLVVPHTHPRANEFILVTQGTVFTQFLTESGSILVTNNLTTFSGTVFPQGSFHLEFNPTCSPAMFTSGFNENDPGVSAIAANFLSFDPELVGATLGGDQVVSGADLAGIKAGLPSATVIQIAECLTACGIKPNKKRSLKEIIVAERG
jgi:hypothetical protein